MAIFHLSAKIISRSSGRSVTAASAYRAAEKIADVRTGQVFDYRRKREVSFRHIYAPHGAPEWVSNRSALWNSVEQAEKRWDAQLARELDIALPVELAQKQQIHLLESFVHSQFTMKGMVADVCLHSKAGNPHAHIMLTLRELHPQGFGKKRREWNTTELLEEWRRQWASHCNRKLTAMGIKERIDHRSLEAQGIHRLPTVHEGTKSQALRAKGRSSVRQELNNYIKEENMNQANTPTTVLRSPRRHQPFFITAPAAQHRDQTQRMFDRTYGELLLDWLKDLSPHVQWFQTDIGWCYRIHTPQATVYDYGSGVRCESGSSEEIRLAVALAKAKGWEGMQLNGSPAFKREAFLEAVKAGFDVRAITGYEPTKEDLEIAMGVKPRLQVLEAEPAPTLGFVVDDGTTSATSTMQHTPKFKR